MDDRTRNAKYYARKMIVQMDKVLGDIRERRTTPKVATRVDDEYSISTEPKTVTLFRGTMPVLAMTYKNGWKNTSHQQLGRDISRVMGM